MNVIQMKGHEKPIMKLKYNRDGDLLFCASQDYKVSCWDSQTGIRIGTFNGHNGRVNDISISDDSEYLLSASQDFTIILWDVCNGETLKIYPTNFLIGGVCFAEGSQEFAMIGTSTRDEGASIIQVYGTPSKTCSPSDYNDTPIWELTIDYGKPTCIAYSAGNEYLFVTYQNGQIEKRDASNGEVIAFEQLHSESIKDISFDKNGVFFATCSQDMTAKLIDPETLEVVKEYKTDRPLSGVAISPLKDHILVGGGQSAESITVDAASGKFETLFYEMIYEECFGKVRGHFGPINTVAINPDGQSFCSGSFDGFVRLHHFDHQYLLTGDKVPSEEEIQKEEEAHKNSDLLQMSTLLPKSSLNTSSSTGITAK